MRGYNDDLVMAYAIGCWVKDTALTVNQKDVNYQRAQLNSMFIANKQIRTTIPGMQGHNAEKGFSDDTMELKQQYNDFVWLIKG